MRVAARLRSISILARNSKLNHQKPRVTCMTASMCPTRRLGHRLTMTASNLMSASRNPLSLAVQCRIRRRLTWLRSTLILVFPRLLLRHLLKPADTLPEIGDDGFESAQVATAVNPDFATEQTETIVSPNFASTPEPDLLPPQDFSMAQLETQLNQAPVFDLPDSAGDDYARTQEETVVNPQFGESEELAPEFEISANEEVATKLDLAKAYEEMGDFEGASELLQEVLKEGDVSQKEMAQAILAKINH